MVKRCALLIGLGIFTALSVQAEIPHTGLYQGQYQITMRAAPLGNILGYGVTHANWQWDFDNDTAVVSGTTLSVGFNYALHDLNNQDAKSDVLHFTRNADGTLTLHYALQIYHPGLGNPMANTSTRFAVTQEGAKLMVKAIDWEANGPDGIVGTQIPNVFPLVIEPDLAGFIVASGQDSNHDGIEDHIALQLGLDPNALDSDNDGISDWQELAGNLSTPLDSDGDSVIDALEPGSDAHNPHLASGLTTLNQQRLSVDGYPHFTLHNAQIGSMLKPVSNPDNSDDFIELDSTLGQPGLDYPWGNLALTFSPATSEFQQQSLRLRFSAHLPQKLLLYAYQPNANHQYQRIPASRIRRDDDRTITLLLNSDDAWLQPNASGQPQLTLALAENTLGDVAREQHAGSSAGSLAMHWLWFLGIIAVWRRRPSRG